MKNRTIIFNTCIIFEKKNWNGKIFIRKKNLSEKNLLGKQFLSEKILSGKKLLEIFFCQKVVGVTSMT